MKKAMFYDNVEKSKVCCYLCPHNCVIKLDSTGICGVRKNKDGELYLLNYGKVTAAALDPIEKKPLRRFRPGSYILSLGSYGCNLKCSFCQNWRIAHNKADYFEATSQDIVDRAIELKSQGNIGVAYTYNEPSVWYDFVYETSVLVKKHGLANVMVTNGFINEQPLNDILPFIDAINIDLKSFSQHFYDSYCKGDLESVKRTIVIAAEQCHVEITTLVIPELNDSCEEIERLAKWISSVSSKIPLHLSRYFPNYKLNERPPTPVSTLKELQARALELLEYVYIGNI